MSYIEIIRGLPFLKLKWFKKELIESTMDYLPKDGDVILASYPKTGSTWLQYIMQQIITKGEHFSAMEEMYLKTWPLVEMVGAEGLDKLDSPRMYKHHYPYQMVKKNVNSKVVYIYRHPADNFVSCYHFVKGLANQPVPFENAFEAFLEGRVAYGCYFEHVLSYWNHRHDKNLLMVSYERLQRDKKGEILRIAKFLGDHFYESLMEDQKLLEDILEKTTFEYMKKNLSDSATLFGGNDEFQFWRKGKVGDGKTALTQDQMRRLRELAEKKMKGTDILEEWYK